MMPPVWPPSPHMTLIYNRYSLGISSAEFLTSRILLCQVTQGRFNSLLYGGGGCGQS